ncbi:MAG: hypothetical protein H7122_03545 [Chitinophagaceae bacterium]|nr:hypothetical protein [Chitinophagaceae bacterium]
MKQITFFLVVFIVMLQPLVSQTPKETITAMNKLLFMDGSWKGIGWTETGGRKQSFRETETVMAKLSGTAIQIEAFGIALEDSTTVVNDALGIVSFNVNTKQYILRIFQSDGSFMEADAKIIEPNIFEWSLKYPGGYIKYTIRVVNKKWIEKGYRSNDATNWTQTFEMELMKQ